MANFNRVLLTGAGPIVFAFGFAELARVFDYPQILRQPAGTVLTRFAAQQGQILPLWWMMFAAALAFIPVSVAVARWSGLTGTRLAVAQAVGIAGGLVQAIGLSRWVFAVPVLADHAAQPDGAKTATLLFDLIHNWMGVGLGEWAGYLFTAAWTAILATSYISRMRWFAIAGLVVSLGIGFGLLEVFGVSSAGPVNAIAYSLWVFWMLGLAVILGRSEANPQTN